MHVTRVPACMLVRVRVCARIRAGSSTTEETPNGVLHAYRSIFGSLSPSSSVLPHRDLWNMSNRTPSQLTSRFKPLHFSTHLSATWKLIVALFHNNSIYIYIYEKFVQISRNRPLNREKVQDWDEGVCTARERHIRNFPLGFCLRFEKRRKEGRKEASHLVGWKGRNRARCSPAVCI